MYYTIIITDAQTIFRFDTIDGAIEKFYYELAYAMNQRINCTCLVIDKHGATYKSEEYVVAVAEPEEE